MNLIWHPIHLYRIQDNKVDKLIKFGTLSKNPTDVRFPDQLPDIDPFDVQGDIYLLAHVSSTVDTQGRNLLHFSTFHIAEAKYHAAVLKEPFYLRRC